MEGVEEAAAERQGVHEDDDGAGNDDAPLFSCRLDNAKVISTVLSCLSHGTRRAQHAQCEATPKGLVFIVTGRAKFTQVLQLSYTLVDALRVWFAESHISLMLKLSCLRLS
jgi:hypothetical protein